MARNKRRKKSRDRRDDDERPRRSKSKGRRSSKSGFKYRERGKEAWQKRSEQSGYNRRSMFKDEVTVFRPKDADNLIRILPPTWEDAEHYGHEIWCHYDVGGDRDSFLDLSKMLGEADPIEEERVRALQDNDKEYADKLQSKKRVAVYIVDRDEPEKGVQLWSMPWTIDADVTTLAVDKRSGEVLNIDDPEDGYDVEFTKSGKGIKTQYSGIQIARRSSPLDHDEALEQAVDLPIPEALVYFPYDEIKKAFNAGGSAYDDDDDEDDGDDDEKPRGRRGRSSKKSDKRRGRGKYDEDDDEDDGEDEESDAAADDMPSYDALMEMDIDELFDLIDNHDLDVDDDIDEDDDEEVDDLRSDIGKELGIKKPGKRRAKKSERRKLRKRGRGRRD